MYVYKKGRYHYVGDLKGLFIKGENERKRLRKKVNGRENVGKEIISDNVNLERLIGFSFFALYKKQGCRIVFFLGGYFWNNLLISDNIYDDLYHFNLKIVLWSIIKLKTLIVY